MDDFHFLRPFCLALVPVVIVLAYWWREQQSVRTGWSGFVDPHLLAVQFICQGGEHVRWLQNSIPFAVVIALLAAAGPSWEQEQSPSIRQQSGRVFALDLSQSMNAADLKPSRLVMARLKLIDLLQASRDRQVGLMVFAAKPYVVSPLTDDALTLSETAAALTTALVPTQGSDLSAAIDYAHQLLQQSGMSAGEIVLITDSQANDQALESARRVAQTGVEISVLAVGTESGAPVPGRNGQALRSEDGRPLIVSLASDSLKELASVGSGRYSTLKADSSDIQKILPVLEFNQGSDTQQAERRTEKWLDRGPWLLWLLMPWGLWLFSARWF